MISYDIVNGVLTMTLMLPGVLLVAPPVSTRLYISIYIYIYKVLVHTYIYIYIL